MPTWEQIADFRSPGRASSEEEISLFQLRVIWVVTREINRLRDLHGLPQYTSQQVVQAIKTAPITDEPQV